jgi:hypothetical protein
MAGSSLHFDDNEAHLQWFRDAAEQEDFGCPAGRHKSPAKRR